MIPFNSLLLKMKALCRSNFPIFNKPNYVTLNNIAFRMPYLKLYFFCTGVPAPFSKTLNKESLLQCDSDKLKDTIDVLRRWCCNETDVLRILMRRPSLGKMEVNELQCKLRTLSGLGITSNDLVKMIQCRPRFLTCHINNCLDERLAYLQSLFGSRDLLLKGIIRNPSVLTYDVHKKIKPIIDMYEKMGVGKKDLIAMLLSRPTLISRTSLNDEKLDYIRRTEVPKESRMYKYVVTLFAVSRLETIREKMANLEKFGFLDDEILKLFGRSPFLLTLSVDKVQRNMTFILGMMKLSANIVLDKPCLLFANLETLLKPRVFLSRKIQELNLVPQMEGPSLFRALRMKEQRFLKDFVHCHPKDIAKELMEYYTNLKGVKRLAESSKKKMQKGFPF